MKSKLIFCVIGVLLATSIDARRTIDSSDSDTSETKEILSLEKSRNRIELSVGTKSQLKECTGSNKFANKLEDIFNDENSTPLTRKILEKAASALPRGGDLEEDLLESLTSCYFEARKESRSKQVQKFIECAADDTVDDCESSSSEWRPRKRRSN